MTVSTTIPTPIRGLMPIFAALMLAACEDGADDRATASRPSEDTMAKARATDTPAASPEATSTRDDVIAALRCHAVLSSAMANRVVVDKDGSAVVGVREQTRWFAEADRRADAAGLSKDEFRTLMAETGAPMITEADQAKNRRLMEQCLANLPAL